MKKPLTTYSFIPNTHSHSQPFGPKYSVVFYSSFQTHTVNKSDWFEMLYSVFKIQCRAVNIKNGFLFILSTSLIGIKAYKLDVKVMDIAGTLDELISVCEIRR